MVITNLYSIFLSTLTLHDRNFFTIILFCRLLATSTQCLVWNCHHKSLRASADWMKTDLEQIHFSLHITTDITNLLRAVEIYFGGNTNYAKGKGDELMFWMNC